MIDRIRIQNFKSIYDLELEVKRINLFIGENGSGKSNLFEALAFASAANSNKLDNEFLVSRGLRVPEPTLMRSAFVQEDHDKDITIDLNLGSLKKGYVFTNDNQAYSSWKIKDDPTLDDEGGTIQSYLEHEFFHRDFMIYSPENSSLRTFQKEGQIQPLGINGEGLFKLLKVVNRYEDRRYMETIITSLKLFSWFDELSIPQQLAYGEDAMTIQDKYLYRTMTQYSANEGFLFVLFYITLMVAKETPKVFAIDNIDTSLNPKLCAKLMTVLTDLAVRYDKQVFLTTHNPAVLDGIDLGSDAQGLFVVSRNKQGHTRVKTITPNEKPKSSNDEPLLLSEAFMRGYLGGLPKGF